MLRPSLMSTTPHRAVSESQKCASQAVTPRTRPPPAALRVFLPCLGSNAPDHAAPRRGCRPPQHSGRTFHTGWTWTPSSAHPDFQTCASFPLHGFLPHPGCSGLWLPSLDVLPAKMPSSLSCDTTHWASPPISFLLSLLSLCICWPFKAEALPSSFLALWPSVLSLSLSSLLFPFPIFFSDLPNEALGLNYSGKIFRNERKEKEKEEKERENTKLEKVWLFLKTNIPSFVVDKC